MLFTINFRKFTHFCMSLNDLRQELEKSHGKLGERYLEYLETGAAIRGILDWLKGEIQALPGIFKTRTILALLWPIFLRWSKNLAAGMCLNCEAWLLLAMPPCRGIYQRILGKLSSNWCDGGGPITACHIVSIV
jgi:hypothetical protein